VTRDEFGGGWQHARASALPNQTHKLVRTETTTINKTIRDAYHGEKIYSVEHAAESFKMQI
jgi:hypothetical protein